ncbi:hypothetical protein Tco_0553858 [Tanacetum coccineum]
MFGRTDTPFRLYRPYAILSRRLDTPHPTGGYAVSDYVPGPEHPPSPDYVPGPKEPEQAPHSLEYVPEPEYPEYLAPSDDEAPMEDQPLLADASPTALSPGYVTAPYQITDEEEDPLPAIDPVHSVEDTEAFETDNLPPTPPIYLDLAGIGLSIPSPPLHVSSPPLPLPPPSVASPTYVKAPLGYRAIRIWIRAASPPLPLPAPSSPLLLLN